MVSRDGRTVTADEAAVMRMLLDHADVDVEVGPRTEVYRRRPWPYNAADRDRDAWPLVPTVDQTVARRLVKVGWVSIDSGGIAHLTDAGVAATTGDER